MKESVGRGGRGSKGASWGGGSEGLDFLRSRVAQENIPEDFVDPFASWSESVTSDWGLCTSAGKDRTEEASVDEEPSGKEGKIGLGGFNRESPLVIAKDFIVDES